MVENPGADDPWGQVDLTPEAKIGMTPLPKIKMTPVDIEPPGDFICRDIQLMAMRKGTAKV